MTPRCRRPDTEFLAAERRPHAGATPGSVTLRVVPEMVLRSSRPDGVGALLAGTMGIAVALIVSVTQPLGALSQPLGALSTVLSPRPSVSVSGGYPCTEQGATACGAIFPAVDGPLSPGVARRRTVTATFSNARVRGLYLTGFASRAAGSSALCTAADPAAAVTLKIEGAPGLLYSGTLSDFGRAHGSTASMLPLPTGSDTQVLRFTAGYSPSAGAPYMGCVSSGDFAWYAAQ